MLTQAASFSLMMLPASFLPFKRKGRQLFQTKEKKNLLKTKLQNLAVLRDWKIVVEIFLKGK
jgi:hypothetical protein